MAGFLESLSAVIYQVGQMARNTKSGVNTLIEELQPAIRATLKAADALTDEKKRQQALARLDEYTARVMANASSKLRKSVGLLQESFKGAPPEVATRLAAFTVLQEVADAKNALDLKEVLSCEQLVAEIRALVAADASTPSYEQLVQRMDSLLEVASGALDELHCDEEELRRQLISAQTLREDIGLAVVELAKQRQRAREIIKDANVQDDQVLPEEIDLLNECLLAIETEIENGEFASACVHMHNWRTDAEAILSARLADAQTIKKQADRPDTMRGFLSTLVLRAQQREIFVDAVAQAAATALAAIKLRPCDIADAEAKVRLFEELVR